MNRASIYLADENGPYTFDFDEKLPSLPLPDLHNTLERYFDSLKPFGTAAELEYSKALLADFERGVGASLHEKIKERSANHKNWLSEWWEKYAYHSMRIPLSPYTVMSAPLRLDIIGLEETEKNALKNLARVVYHFIEHWDLLRKSKIKPMESNGGKIKYSSALFKRFYSTVRAPGVEYDHIKQYFKPESEGPTPTHGLVSGKGRVFIFDMLHEDDTIITAPELLLMLQRLRCILDEEEIGDCVPILTHDDRSVWAKNYQRLAEISPENKAGIELIESAAMTLVIDENEPRDYEEAAQAALFGDFHSRWGDKSSTVVGYKSGKITCIGEHSSYDGTISISCMLYVHLSILEAEEPDWFGVAVQRKPIPFKEIKLKLDNELKSEISRLVKEFKIRGHDVIVNYTVFDDYGKDFIKTQKLHPDSFVQIIMQWAYTRMHNEIVPTYETALMRQYYNGRTETLRSCTPVVHKFLQMTTNPDVNEKELLHAFRAAVEHHNHTMNEARKGNGVDRHLFGLWCAAHENGIEIPSLFDDPLYAKSGGGGNFVLSTSTLGYTVNNGFVAPMVLDGYGIFYSITSNAIFIESVVYRDSKKTSARKYSETFKDTFRLAKKMLESVSQSNL